MGVGIMKEIALKESDISKLKEYPLNGIISTESNIYYYKKEPEWTKTKLLKKLYLTDEKRVYRKERTIDALQRSELSTYKELVIPEQIVTIQGIKSGFTIEEITDSMNLSLFLKDKKIPNTDKLLVLKKIGELLRRVQSCNQEFYFGDLQEFNFLVNKNLDIYVVDLDSSAISRTKPLETKYISIDKKTHQVPKYKVNRARRCYPNKDIDTYCYNTLVLNYLAGQPLHRLSFEEYTDYLIYLDECDFPKEFIDIYYNHYSDKSNESVLDYLDDLPKDYGRAYYGVHKALQKLR